MSDDDEPKKPLTPKILAKKVLEAGVGIGATKVEEDVKQTLAGMGPVGERIGKEAGKLSEYIGGGLLDMIPGLGSEPLDRVSYEVEISGGPDLDWKVRSVHFVEQISAPYELSLELLTSFYEAADSVDGLLGADLTFVYGRNGVYRVVCGVIAEVGTIGIASDELKIRVVVKPALSSLAQRVDTRIFQDQTIPKILESVLGEALGEYARKVDAGRLNDTYLPRDYCVQFKESDLDFCHRLMREEGIAYYFEVLDDTVTETMILTDHNPGKPNGDFPEVEAVIEETVPIIASRPETSDSESIQGLTWSRHQSVTKVTTRQFNWKRPDPNAPPEFTAEQEDARGRMREVYVPDDRRRIEDKDGDASYEGTEVDEDERPQTSKYFETLSVENGVGEGTSNVTGFRAGGCFTIADHPHPDLVEARLMLVRVEHRGEAPELEVGDSVGEPRYENSFTCISEDVPYRPLTSPTKPKVYGAQTATVTGPDSEEVHTDIHGRVKVRFHWDRLSPLDENSSCWVRVAQMWSGPGWGTWFLPRIGMEVIVQFLDGNPDRPLVVGCVYNGENKPPYTLPDNKTMTTIKTNSSIGGGGFNELRFEDMKGAEQVYVHAQKNYDEMVQNNRTRTVGSNETVTVQGNRSLTINGEPANGESSFRGQDVSVIGDETIYVRDSRVTTIGQNAVTAVMKGHNLAVGEGLASSEPAAGKLMIDAENEIEIKCGASKLVMLSDGTVQLTGRTFNFEAKGPIFIKGTVVEVD